MTDGRIPEKMALLLAKKRPKILAELTSNDVEQPSLVKVGTDYILHDFAEHQTTRADIEHQTLINTENGKRGGRPKANRNETEPVSETKAKESQRQSTESETDTHSKDHVQNESARNRVLLDEFASWWLLYPRKQGKADAYKAYKAARKLVDAKTLEKAVSAYLLANVGQDKNYLKMPAGWLRGERWEDDQIASVPLPPRAGLGMCVLHPEYPEPCDKCARGGNEF